MRKAPSFVPYQEAIRSNVSRLSSLRKHAARIHVLKVVLATLAILVGGAATAAFGWFGHLSANLNNSDVITTDLTETLSAPVAAGEPFYVALLGVDRSEERKDSSEYGKADSNYRSDSMMVVRVAPKDKKITLVSLHRDTAMDFGSKNGGIQKLNACYPLGGASLAVKTIGEFADVPIQHYAEIDFDGLTEIVDALGGVEVDVPMDIYDPNYTELDLKKGIQTVDGHTALMLCRARHAFDDIGDGDLYRAANQRMVLGAIAKKALSADPATIVNTITALSGCVRTDLKLDKIIELLLNFQGIDPSTDIMSGFEPTTGAYVNDTWYEVVDKDAWRLMMTRVGLGLSPWSDESQDATNGKNLIVNGDEKKVTVTSKAGKNALTEDDLLSRLGGTKSYKSKYSDDDDEDIPSSSSSKVASTWSGDDDTQESRSSRDSQQDSSSESTHDSSETSSTSNSEPEPEPAPEPKSEPKSEPEPEPNPEPDPEPTGDDGGDSGSGNSGSGNGESTTTAIETGNEPTPAP